VVFTSQSQVFPMTLAAFFNRHNFSFTVNQLAVRDDLCVGFNNNVENCSLTGAFSIVS